MTSRDKWKRINAYARISKRVTDWFRGSCRLSGDTYRVIAGQLDYLRERERHAWSRLPDNLRSQLQP